MSAIQLYEAGFRDLVSVIPPGSPLSQGSKIKPEILGKVPGLWGPNGWYGYNFVSAGQPRIEDVRQWDARGASVGMMGRGYPALDIDVEDETLSRVIVDFAQRHFGPTPIRLSREPRRLLVYRTEEPFPKMRLSFGEHAIEFLGEGRQYLVAGKHPSGVEYGWQGDQLHEVGPGGLTLITPEQVADFFAQLQGALDRKGIESKLTGRTTQHGEAPPQEELKAPSIEDIAQVVAMIPNPGTNGWDAMIEMGYAIKASGGDGAEYLFQDWCATWDGPNDPDLNATNWASFHGPFRVGWSWLCHKAGRRPTSARDVFVADPALWGHEEPDPAPTVLYSDEAMVDLVLPQIRGEAIYLPADGQWRVWSGHQWLGDDRLQHQLVIRRLLRAEALRLQDRARAAATKAEGASAMACATRFQSRGGISAVTELLQARLSMDPSDFDANPLQLNTPAGTIDLRTGEATDPDPLTLVSRSTSVAPRPGTPVRWAQFIDESTGGDRELGRYIQKVLGYALTGDTSVKALWFLWGGRDTGKSTFLRVVRSLLGDYEESVDASTFISNMAGDNGNNHKLADLNGVRLVTATEPSVGQRWDEKTIKAITGGDPIRARRLYGQFSTFSPQFKILVTGNFAPEINDISDEAMLSRIHIVPFDVHVPPERQDLALTDRLLTEEGPQILQWLIDGCVAWYHEGLAAPEAVIAQNAAYVEAEDSFSQWIEEECELGAEYMAARDTLYQSWRRWAERRGESTLGGVKSFKRKLESSKATRLSEARVPPRRLRGYRGIRLAPLNLENV